MVDKVSLKHVFSESFSFPLVYHCPMRCVIDLTKQHIIISFTIISDLALGCSDS
jgi:hypothetical protein